MSKLSTPMIGYDWIVNTKNRLKSVVPRVFNFGAIPFFS